MVSRSLGKCLIRFSCRPGFGQALFSSIAWVGKVQRQIDQQKKDMQLAVKYKNRMFSRKPIGTDSQTVRSKIPFVCWLECRGNVERAPRNPAPPARCTPIQRTAVGSPPNAPFAAAPASGPFRFLASRRFNWERQNRDSSQTTSLNVPSSSLSIRLSYHSHTLTDVTMI
jgi:hypothetical protein